MIGLYYYNIDLVGSMVCILKAVIKLFGPLAKTKIKIIGGVFRGKGSSKEN